MAIDVQTKPNKKSTLKSVKIDKSTNGKNPSQESLLFNTLNGIQNDIREIRTDNKKLDEKNQNEFRELRANIKVLDVNLNQKIDSKFDKLDEKTDSNFKWTLGVMASLVAFMFAVIFFLHSDLKSSVNRLETNMGKLETSLRGDIKKNSDSITQIHEKLDKLLSK